MSGFDANRVYSVSVHDVPAATSPDSPSETEKLLFEFIQQFRVGSEFVYRYDVPYQFHLCNCSLSAVINFVETSSSNNTYWKLTFVTSVFIMTSLRMPFKIDLQMFYLWWSITFLVNSQSHWLVFQVWKRGHQDCPFDTLPIDSQLRGQHGSNSQSSNHCQIWS